MQKKQKSIKARLAEEVGDGTAATRNPDIERSLLKTCLGSHEKLRMASSLVLHEHFSDPRHKVVFKAAVDMESKGIRPYPNVVLAEVMKRSDDEIDPEEFRDAMSAIMASDNTDVESACLMVHDLYVARKLQSISHEVISRASAGEDIHGLISELETNLKGISSAGGSDTLMDVDQLIESLPRGAMSIIEPDTSGIKTPFPDLNDLIYGFKPGDVTVVGARPGVGKTVFLAQLAYHAATLGELTLFYALEMGKEEVWRRLMCAECSVINVDVNNLELSRDEKARCDEWLRNGASRFLHVSDRGGRTPAAIRADVQRKINKYGKVGLVVVDFIQLMSSGKGHMKRYEEVTDISRSMKYLATDLGTHVLTASSMNREIERRQGKDRRPQLSDLNESGNLESDASLVIFPHRPSMTHTDVNRPAPDDELIVFKNRYGRTGSVKVKYRGEYFRFDNMPGPNSD
jgi:replicative DNA helicase